MVGMNSVGELSENELKENIRKYDQLAVEKLKQMYF